jgi:hypothetical protein
MIGRSAAHRLHIRQQLQDKRRIRIALLQRAQFLFGFIQEPGLRIEQSQRQMRRSEGAPRLDEFIRFHLIQNAEFRLRLGRTRRTEFLSIFDGFHLPGINNAAAEGSRRCPRVRSDFAARGHQVESFVINLNDVVRRAIQRRPAESRTIGDQHFSDGLHDNKFPILFVAHQRTFTPAAGPGAMADTASEFVQRRPASWARLIKKIFEVDPLLCVCGAEMKIVSIITDFRVVDRILRHLRSQACRARDPFEPRAPPQAGGNSLQ